MELVSHTLNAYLINKPTTIVFCSWILVLVVHHGGSDDKAGIGGNLVDC